MKTRTVLTILTIGMIASTYAQKPTMTLIFAADSNGQHIPLNIVLIENLAQGGDTTLYAPDTALVFDYVTGIAENETIRNNGFTVLQNFPNPMEGKTTISLYLPEAENVLFTINDLVGKKLILREYRLEQGNHSFTFYPGSENLYFLTAHTDQQSQTIKMCNSPSHAFVSGNCKLEYNGQQTGSEKYRSGNNLNNFVFSLGDQLKFTAFTAMGERIITSFPTGDQTYYFHYSGEPCTGMPTVTDIDGNMYNTVLIGSQCWMKENLKTTTYSNSTSIPNVTDANAWSNLTTGAYAWYDNDTSWKDSYGALYNWYATVDTNGLCPTGWHVPTHDEWTDLIDYIGGTSSPHGNELKSCRQVNSPLGSGYNTNEHPRWNGNGTFGTDDYGFSGLPGGLRGSYGCYAIGTNGNWWSSTAYSSGFAWTCGLYYYIGNVYVYDSTKQAGRCIRCLRD